MQESRVQSLSWRDPLVKEMATHSCIPAWRIPRIEEPGELQSMGSRRVGLDRATNTNTTKQWESHLPEKKEANLDPLSFVSEPTSDLWQSPGGPAWWSDPSLGSALVGAPADPVVKAGWRCHEPPCCGSGGLWGAASCSPLMIEMALSGPSSQLPDFILCLQVQSPELG